MEEPQVRALETWDQVSRDFGLSDAKTVAAYVAVREELDTRPLLERRFEQQLGTVLPRVDGDHLQLFQVHGWDELEKGPFGLREPSQALPDARRIAPEDVDLIFVPGLAFDERGGRLGYGKGHYDRLLAQMRPEAPRVGLCFEEQIVDAVPMEAHDVAMTHLGTPERLVDCRRG
ncbi:MAG: 5-formyltetrahydrofolate cyclo-ligase [Acidobacteriota bacterium]